MRDNLTTAPVLRVALDTPLRRLFDYLPPCDSTSLPAIGARVRVPFGRQQLVGVICAHAAASELPREKLKAVLEVLDAVPVVDERVMELAEWAAQYYHHPLGEVLSAALPKLARAGAASRATTERWHVTGEGAAALAANSLTRAPRQRELLESIGSDGICNEQLADKFADWRTPMRALVARGFVSSAEVVDDPDIKDTAALVRSRDHRSARNSHRGRRGTCASGRFAPFLPCRASPAVARPRFICMRWRQHTGLGKRALILVRRSAHAELVSRFRERLPARGRAAFRAHDTERLAALRQCVSGQRHRARHRSAVFAPVADPASSSSTRSTTLRTSNTKAAFDMRREISRYCARSARRFGGTGVGDPALETLQNVLTGKFTRLSLPRRAGQAMPPRAAMLDLREHAVRSGLATPAVEAMQKHLAAGSQVLVYINRRGYSPTLACTACGWIAPCRDCDARLTVHLGAARLRCHHCGADAPLPEKCPQCGYAVKHVGQGTERVEETLAKLFPDMPIARLDRDVVRKRGDLEQVVNRINSGEARILVGTQMVTKGHDFPNVTLVVVLNADQGLFSTDFRAPERVAQSIIQVAGRAGRGVKAGDVLVQTEYPEHPLLVSLLTNGYDGFAQTALAERAAAGWPPFAHVAVLRASSVDLAPAIHFLREARRLARPPKDLKLLGPAPAAMARRAGRHHAQLLLESRDRAPLHRLLAEWLPRVEELKNPRDLRWSLDIDPLDLF